MRTRSRKGILTDDRRRNLVEDRRRASTRGIRYPIKHPIKRQRGAPQLRASTFWSLALSRLGHRFLGGSDRDGVFTREVWNVLDADDGLQRAGVRAAQRFCFLSTGSWVAAPGALRAVDNPERSKFANGDHHPTRISLCRSTSRSIPSPGT